MKNDCLLRVEDLANKGFEVIRTLISQEQYHHAHEIADSMHNLDDVGATEISLRQLVIDFPCEISYDLLVIFESLNGLKSTTSNDFDSGSWREKCQKHFNEALSGTGGVYELFLEKFSDLIDIELKEVHNVHLIAAVKIARDFDYASIIERLEQNNHSSSNGYCIHHIELGCCPAGCGSF